jgi:hypothetical protein
MIEICTNTGTYLDVPFHRFAGPLHQFAGLDCPSGRLLLCETMSRIHDALAALDQQLDRVGHPIARYREPGLTRAEIEAAFEPIGLNDLPEEAVALWEWQSSTEGPANQAGDAWPVSNALPGGYGLWPISKVLTWYRTTPFDDLASAGLTPQHIPAFGNENLYGWIDCRPEGDAPCPVIFGSIVELPIINHRFESVSDLIEEMTRMLAEEVWTNQVTDYSDNDWDFVDGTDFQRYAWTWE